MTAKESGRSVGYVGCGQRSLPVRGRHRYNPMRYRSQREVRYVPLTPNIAASVFNTFAAAFFVLLIVGVAVGVYAARQLKKLEPQPAAEEEKGE